MEGINEKQKKFCHQYIIDWAKARSYMYAYPESTYEAAAVSAHDLLKKPKIIEYIDSIKNNLEEEAGISKLMVIKEHQKIAFTSIAHIHDTWIDLTEFEKIPDNVKSCISEIHTQVVKRRSPIGDGEFEVLDVEQVKVKLFDKQKSLDSISKLLGYDQELKIDVKSGGESIAPITWVTNEPNK